jgi:phenylacetate-CoA ligase
MDMRFIRGNNVFPSAIEGILRGVAGGAEFGWMWHSETRSASSASKSNQCPPPTRRMSRREPRMRSRPVEFPPTVRAVAPGTLPRFEMKAKRFVRTECKQD